MGQGNVSRISSGNAATCAPVRGLDRYSVIDNRKRKATEVPDRRSGRVALVVNSPPTEEDDDGVESTTKTKTANKRNIETRAEYYSDRDKLTNLTAPG